MSKKAARSKFVHAYLNEPDRADLFADVPQLYTDGDNSGNMSASSTMLAMAKIGSGGPVLITPLNKCRRWDKSGACLASLKGGHCTSLEWSPHDPQILCMGGDTGNVQIVSVPETGLEGMSANVTKADLELSHHVKKVQFIAWNRNARNILATSAYEKNIVLWNAETGQALQKLEDVSKLVPTDLVWDSMGARLCYGSKDPCAQLIDPRAPEAKESFEAFNGKKSNKFWFMPSFGWIGGLGYATGNKHQIKIWDLKKLDSPIFKMDLAQPRNKAFVHYDEDIHQCYVWNKGSTQVMHFEISDVVKTKQMKLLNTHQTPKAAQFKAGCWLPKRCLNTKICEVGAFMANYKQTNNRNNNIVARLSIINPRKATSFQKELFPPSWNGEPVLDAEQWEAGEAAALILSSMNPEDHLSDEKKEKRKTYKELQQEVEELRARLAKYES